MKLKKETVILGVVIVALAAYLTLRGTDRTHYRLPVLETVSAGELTKIEIKSPASTITLSKNADRWEISPEGYPADESKVKQMAAVVSDLALTALVSESEAYNRYDLGDDKKITVTAWSGDKVLRQFDLGKTASTFKHTFVKIASDPRVYHARDNFRHAFDTPMDGLREKTVLDFEIKDIREIHITSGDRKQVFTRVDEPAATADDSSKEPKPPVWRRADGEALDSAAVDAFLSTLDGLACDRYIYEPSKSDLKNPVYTVELKGTRSHTLSLFEQIDKENGDYPARSSENPYPFELTAFRADNIINSFEKQEGF